MRETTLELLAILVPRTEGQISVTEVTVPISSPVPIPFTFTPGPQVLLKPGLAGDVTANWHTNKGPNERDMFSLGGMLQVPLGGRAQFDSLGAHTAGGGKNMMAMKAEDRLHFDIEQIQNDINNTLVSGIGSDGISVAYSPVDGRVSIMNPKNVELTAVEISSGDSIFVNANDAINLQGPIDKKTVSTVVKIGLGESFTSVEFGAISRPGLDLGFLLRDLSARALKADGTAINRIGLEVSGQ